MLTVIKKRPHHADTRAGRMLEGSGAGFLEDLVFQGNGPPRNPLLPLNLSLFVTRTMMTQDLEMANQNDGEPPSTQIFSN